MLAAGRANRTMSAGLVAVGGLAAITAAGMLHRSRRGGRGATLALFLVVAVLAIGTTIAAATINFANCDCR